MKPLARAELYALLLAVPLAALCAWLALEISRRLT